MIGISVLVGFSIVIIAILIIIAKTHFKLNDKISLKVFFILFLLSTSIFILSPFILHGKVSTIIPFLGSLWMYSAFAFVLLHSSHFLKTKNILVLFLISLSFGLISEALGVKYGFIFGNYYYTGNKFFFGLVPLLTPISWAIIIYMCYSITNLIFSENIKGYLKRSDDHLCHSIVFIILLSSVDGLISVNLDMILDPVAVSLQIPGWVWTDGGPYFGIPISNFVGWFLVTFGATFIFRLYNLFSPGERKIAYFNYIYILALYLIYFLMHMAQALNMGHIEYVLIGATTMLPFALIAAINFFIRMSYLREDY